MYDYPEQQAQPVPQRAPGPVVAGAIVFGGLYAALGFFLGLSGFAMGRSPAVATAAVFLGIAAVVVAYYCWRGRAWAQIAAVVLSVGGLVLAFVAGALSDEPEAAGPALICPALIVAVVIGCFVVPQSARAWFGR